MWMRADLAGLQRQWKDIKAKYYQATEEEDE
jgi:hypothetical protein